MYSRPTWRDEKRPDSILESGPSELAMRYADAQDAKAGHEELAVIDITLSAKRPFFPLPLWVLIDGKRVNVLSSDHAQSLRIPAGLHQVQVRGCLRQSETLHLPLLPGERIALECGRHKWDALRFSALRMVVVLAAIPLARFMLPLTGVATLLVGAVLLAIAEWRAFVAPGARLYLKPSGVREIPSSIIPGQRPPQFTLRRLMITIAVIALLTWVGLFERDFQVKRQYQGIARAYSDSAERYDKYLLTLKDHTNRSMKLEETTTAAVDAAGRALKLDPENREAQQRLRDMQALLQVTRNQSAYLLQYTAYMTELRDKYRRAASRPWEPVEPDAPPP